MTSYGTVVANENPTKSKAQVGDDVEEIDPLLSRQNTATKPNDAETSKPQTSLWRLYISHALFMWNNRSYDFASILLTAAAFPDTLLAASIRGLSGHLASLLFSPAVGRWCDRQNSRLKPVWICIILHRLCITFACLGWALLIQVARTPIDDNPTQAVVPFVKARIPFFVLLVLLGMAERLAAVGYVIVVEREWLPLLAAEDATALPDQQPEPPRLLKRKPSLHILNATIKGIDLLTKLVAPLAVSSLAIGLAEMALTSAVVAGTQIVSVVAELHLTRTVWARSAALHAPKVSSGHDAARGIRSRSWLRSFKAYFSQWSCLPSLAFALEPFSVLTLAGSMTAYLLVAHFPLSQITAARTASTTVEVFSTVLTPLLMSRLCRQAYREGENRARRKLNPLVIVGGLGLSWHLISLIPAIGVLLLSPSFDQPRTSATLSTVILFTSLAISRLGPFAFSLVEQQIVQLQVLESERLQFSGVEMALIDFSEMARWVLLGLFGRPDQFRWVALISFVSVFASWFMFIIWARRNGESKRVCNVDDASEE